MIEIEGLLHDGSTSRSREASLRVYTDGSVRLRHAEGEHALSFEALRIPPRLGSTPRRIGVPDGGEFETRDNDAVDALLAAHGHARLSWLHWLESRLTIVVFAAVVVLAAGALFAVRGIPAIAREAAFALSPEISAKLGQGTLEVLDQSFTPTQLPEAQQARLREHFADLTAAAPDGYDFELLFRGGGSFGANAFALPSGSVLMTDELAELAGHDEELVAVLAHEVGHVVHRHGLRQAIQSSLLILSVVIVTGDLSSSSGFVAALPAAIAESRFSRDFEREADDYAVAYLGDNGIDPERFADLLARLEAASGDSAFEITFLSSHPSTEERVERVRSPPGS